MGDPLRPQSSQTENAAQRYLLCRPRGGFNDCLVQMENCFQYAAKFNRTLFIDCSSEKTLNDLSAFFSLLDPMQSVFLNTDKQQIAVFNTMVCFPPQVQGILDSYKTAAFDVIGLGTSVQCCLAGTKTTLLLDFDVDHSEQIVVHENWGGSRRGFQFLKRLKLHEALAAEFRSQISALGQGYAAVHIRHTDMQTDWHWFLTKLKGKLRGRTVLVCSDNADVIKAAASILCNSAVKTISDILPTDGRPLHLRDDLVAEAYQRVMKSALRDLFALGGASDLFLTASKTGSMSGYSRLAGEICLNKDVLASILGTSLDTLNSPVGRLHIVRSFQDWSKRRLRKIKNQFKTVVSKIVAAIRPHSSLKGPS